MQILKKSFLIYYFTSFLAKFSGPLWIVLNFLTWGPFFGRWGTAINTTHFGSGVGPLGGQKGGNVIWFILGCKPQFVPVYWMNPSPNICGWCRLEGWKVAWVKLRYFALVCIKISFKLLIQFSFCALVYHSVSIYVIRNFIGVIM